MMKLAIAPIIALFLAASILTAQDIPASRPDLRPFTADTAEVRAFNPNAITIARLHYQGGGDWYWGNSALPNLLSFLRDETGWPVDVEEKRVKIEDETLFSYPFLFVTGHGTIKFSEEEIERLRQYLLSGGFLFLNDSYGMDKSIRQAVADLFPEYRLEEIPYDHEIYHSFYDFPNGPPKIHEHDNKPATGWGVSVDGRLVLYYVHESDIGDGWEDPQVHNDPPEKRLDALKMGVNIVTYSLCY